MNVRSPAPKLGLILIIAFALHPYAASSLQYGEFATIIDTANATTTTLAPTTTTAKPDRALEAFNHASEKIKRIVMREFYPVISELIYDPRLSTACMGSLMKIATALGNFDIWAIQMVDASGRPHAGMMQGRIASYGAYDQCLAVRHDQGLFQGKYCMVHLKHDGTELSPSLRVIVNKFVEHYGVQRKQLRGFKYMDLKWLCVDFEPIVPCTLEKTRFIIQVNNICATFAMVVVSGRTRAVTASVNARLLLAQQYVGNLTNLMAEGSPISVPLFKIGVCVPSLCQREDLQFIIDFCCLSGVAASFSLRRAFKKLLDMPNWGDYSNELGFVHGMRVLSATWVILGHTHIIRDVHASSDGISFLKRIKEDFLFTVQMNSFMAVETFLVIT
ncbi:hypothetical protein HPB48_012938 [Haemaphysalis longicornis]|uniref:Nose resistant-to-fluoxetine protein N-terminal domain-containing protein n=1 Tax=Haemaphysalis longicornis TaxID=44386 RepID=A0A9J6FCN5_HAELO|nr:hypothetical protein HPB48_012938 [Haemaphysalis longicornis]